MHPAVLEHSSSCLQLSPSGFLAWQRRAVKSPPDRAHAPLVHWSFDTHMRPLASEVPQTPSRLLPAMEMPP